MPGHWLEQQGPKPEQKVLPIKGYVGQCLDSRCDLLSLLMQVSSGRTRREAMYGAESNKLAGEMVSSSRRFLKAEFEFKLK